MRGDALSMLLKSEDVLHAVQAGGPPHQPSGRLQRAAREGDAVGGAMGDFDALAAAAKVTVCSPTMSPRAPPQSRCARLRAAVMPCGHKRRRQVSPARRRRPRPGERRARGRIALHAVMRLADSHVVARPERACRRVEQMPRCTLTPTLVLAAISTGMRARGRSSAARAAASKPVVPTSSGTRAAAQARAWRRDRLGRLKSRATWRRRARAAGSAPIDHAGGRALGRRILAEPRARRGGERAVRRGAVRRRMRRPGSAPDARSSALAHAAGDAEHRDAGHRRRPQSTAPVKNFFTPSKNDCSRGLWLPSCSEASKLRSSSFCSAVRLTGVSTTTRQNRSPARAAAHRAHALLAQPENAAGLGLGRNLEHHFAVERRHLDRATERRGGEADRHLAGEVAAVALEDRMFAHADLDVQVPGGTAVAPRLALAGQADAIAAVDARPARSRAASSPGVRGPGHSTYRRDC